jgi:hypothetical protein
MWCGLEACVHRGGSGVAASATAEPSSGSAQPPTAAESADLAAGGQPESDDEGGGRQGRASLTDRGVKAAPSQSTAVVQRSRPPHAEYSSSGSCASRGPASAAEAADNPAAPFFAVSRAGASAVRIAALDRRNLQLHDELQFLWQQRSRAGG